MKKLKIKLLFIANAQSIHTVKWVDYFIEKDYDVSLITFSKNNLTRCKNVYYLGGKTPNVSGGNYYYLLSIVKIAKIIMKTNPDYVNAHYSYSMGFVSLLALKMTNVQSHFSVVCHGSDILSTPMPFIFDKLNKFVLSNSNKIFAVSEQISDKLILLNQNVNKIFVGQYGVLINDSNNPVVKDIDVLSNRAFIDNSRIDFILEAYKPLENSNLNIVFVLPNINDIEIKRIKLKYPFINFFTKLPYDEMQKMVKRSKVYVSATKSDGTSLSMIEAMSCGVIPVVSNIVSNRSWILDGVNGYLFKTKDELLAKTLIALKLNEDNLQIREINRALIDRECHYQVQMKKIEEFLIL